MSRLGKSPIPLPKGVEVKVHNEMIQVKGPKGTLTHPLMKGIHLKVEDQQVFLSREAETEVANKEYGLLRATLNNLVIGVSKGFEKRLSLIGVGYRAALQGAVLDLQLGFSHPTKIQIPKTVQVAVDKSVLIVITGVDKHAVGQFAAAVRAMRPPEPYKGKGIRYENEYVRKKAGKAAKGKAA